MKSENVFQKYGSRRPGDVDDFVAEKILYQSRAAMTFPYRTEQVTRDESGDLCGEAPLQHLGSSLQAVRTFEISMRARLCINVG
jgi:hypothetical protein